MRKQTVSEVMTKKVFAVKKTETLAEVFQLLNQYSFRHVPVVNDEKEIVGIISERDLLRTCINTETMMIAMSDRGAYLSDHPISEIMSVDPETVQEDTLLADACQTLLENKFDCLPVVRGEELVGILTTADVLKEMVRREEV